jgi:hypothetical protein
MMDDVKRQKIVDNLATHLNVFCNMSWSFGMGKNTHFPSLGGYSSYLSLYDSDFFVSVPDNDGVFKIPKRASVVLLFSLITKSEVFATLVVPANEQLSFKSLLQELKNSKLRLEKDFEVILICDHINTEDMRKIDEYVSSKYGVELKTFFVKNGRAETFLI